MLQRGLGIRVTQVSLDILNGRQLSHIRRTRASEHLVRNASDAGRLACFLEDPEKTSMPSVMLLCEKLPWPIRRLSIVSTIWCMISELIEFLEQPAC